MHAQMKLLFVRTVNGVVVLMELLIVFPYELLLCLSMYGEMEEYCKEVL